MRYESGPKEVVPVTRTKIGERYSSSFFRVRPEKSSRSGKIDRKKSELCLTAVWISCLPVTKNPPIKEVPAIRMLGNRGQT
jgi:hypothetical protein